MPLSKLSRVALHLVLILLMGLASVVAPVTAADDAIASIPGAAVPMDIPCADMGAMQQAPTGSVPKAHCSLAVCLGGAACLPEMPRMAALVPASGRIDAVHVSYVPSEFIDTPLRPPIA